MKLIEFGSVRGGRAGGLWEIPQRIRLAVGFKPQSRLAR